MIKNPILQYNIIYIYQLYILEYGILKTINKN